MNFKEIKDFLTKPVGAPRKGDAPAVHRHPQFVPADVVGIEIGAGDVRGCPAVRLVRRKGVWQVKAFGFVPSPGELPKSWKGLEMQPMWSLPRAFAAQSAAFAVNSADQVVRQTTLDSLAIGDGEKPVPGVPASANGLRYAFSPLGEASFVLESALPEFQVLWLSRLLPEGRRPTACSIQTAASAMIAAVAEQPAFVEAKGNAAVLFIARTSVNFVGFREGKPVLFREFPGLGGAQKIREALISGFGMDEKMIDEVLDDTLIDPSPILEPVLGSLFRQLELSLEYLKSRLGVSAEKVFLMGLTSGAQHWSRMAEAKLNVKLAAPGLFEGVEMGMRLDVEAEKLLKRSHVFLSAFGAARAAMEVGE